MNFSLAFCSLEHWHICCFCWSLRSAPGLNFSPLLKPLLCLEELAFRSISPSWIVDKDREDAKWFQVMGLDQVYWDDQYLIASQSSVAVYKMRPLAEVLKTFDAKSKVGTDLLADGGFESGRSGLRRQWMSLGAVDLGESNSEAKNGTRYLALGSDSKAYRLVPLPAGVRRLEASVWGRTADR